ncbi:hypothetical protein [Actinoallomurus soli]|uniref:hypothetical protein n=1 Tax=Actinoallomurus soli TaxID=2952535 RepID=UPI002092A3E7|nr:hypothetical protein [Actinoallomurus soli]MCO5968084.1 hypothetical protein [Actinoallomurus soli]
MGLILRLLVVAGLAVDAYVHFHLAGDTGSSGGGLTEGTLFWIQGVLAALVAVLVLIRATRLTYGIAFLVAAGALGAVLLYRYVDVGSLGPLPNMYEPVWYAEKVVTTVAEAVSTVAAALGVWLTRTGAGGRRRESSSVTRREASA